MTHWARSTRHHAQGEAVQGTTTQAQLNGPSHGTRSLPTYVVQQQREQRRASFHEQQHAQRAPQQVTKQHKRKQLGQLHVRTQRRLWVHRQLSSTPRRQREEADASRASTGTYTLEPPQRQAGE